MNEKQKNEIKNIFKLIMVGVVVSGIATRDIYLLIADIFIFVLYWLITFKW
jgi:hypothetical protein